MCHATPHEAGPTRCRVTAASNLLLSSLLSSLPRPLAASALPCTLAACAPSLLALPSSLLCPLQDSPLLRTLEVGEAGRQGTRRSALIPSWSRACGGNGGGDASLSCWRGFAGGCSSPGDSSLRDADARKRKTPLPSARTANAGPTAGLVRWLSRHMGALGSSRDMGATDMPFPSGSKPGPSSAPLRSTTPSPLVSTWILSACMTACALVLCGATLPMNKAGLCEVLCVGVVCTR